MGPDRTSRVITSPAEMRAAARLGEWRGSTGGHCPAYQQANLVILPEEAAAEFAAFCSRNPKPCPILEIADVHEPAGGIDVKAARIIAPGVAELARPSREAKTSGLCAVEPLLRAPP
jgi:uncharacterized protein YcsI (UPF0317 family)